MAYRFHLLVKVGDSGRHRQEPAILTASAMSPKHCRVTFTRKLVTYPTDHINKVRQKCCNLGVCLQVLEGDLKRSTSIKENQLEGE